MSRSRSRLPPDTTHAILPEPAGTAESRRNRHGRSPSGSPSTYQASHGRSRVAVGSETIAETAPEMLVKPPTACTIAA
jgi:hypothetical protein